MKKHIALLFACLALSFVWGQNTVGVVSHNPSKAQAGYNLIFPHNQPYTYLLDNCGQIVKQWGDEIYDPGNAAYLHTNGNLYRCGTRYALSNPQINAGGGGEVIDIWSWEGELLWRYAYNSPTYRLHHDIAVMPNGNILAIAWEKKTVGQAIAAGRDPDNLPQGSLWPDHIVELEPVGSNEANIVWEWYAWDHLVQDFDSTKDNYGVVADHPELININYDTHDGAADWLHMNSIDYHPTLDQIVLSVPFFNEIWIIDHSTTTEEAASHMGGRGRRGGDLLYRWGNAAAYDRGAANTQRLYFQHDAHWLDIELTPEHPDYGKIGVFNNRFAENYSMVNTIIPPFDSTTWSYLLTDKGTWGPNLYDWYYTSPEREDFYSDILSNMQRLPNGNTLMTAGRSGYVREITPMGETVWEYKLPLNAGIPVSQGTTIPASVNTFLFRMKRYTPNYPAFIGKDLTPSGYLELEPNTELCGQWVSLEDELTQLPIHIGPNPFTDQLTLDLSEVVSPKGYEIEVWNAKGERVYQFRHNESRISLHTQAWEAGIYLIRINHRTSMKLLRQ